MQKYQNNVQTLDGRAIVGASVTVTEYPSGAAATVYSANGSGVITQPILTNGDGEFAFYAANGRYQLSVMGGGISVAQTISDIVLFDPVDAGVFPESDLANTSDPLKGDALVGVKQPFAGAVARTQHDKNQEVISVKDFGSIADGATDDYLAFSSAKSAVTAGGRVRVNSGSYYLSANPFSGFDKSIVWDIDPKTSFVGPGATGGSGFGRLYTNAFSLASGPWAYIDGSPNPPPGGTTNLYSLEYRGFSGAGFPKTFTATVTNGSAVLTNVSDTSSLFPGCRLSSAIGGWPANTTPPYYGAARIDSISGNTITFKVDSATGPVTEPFTGTTTSGVTFTADWFGQTCAQYIGVDSGGNYSRDNTIVAENIVVNVQSGTGTSGQGTYGGLEIDVNNSSNSSAQFGLLITGGNVNNSGGAGAGYESTVAMRVERSYNSWITGLNIKDAYFGATISAQNTGVTIKSQYVAGAGAKDPSGLIGRAIYVDSAPGDVYGPNFVGGQFANDYDTIWARRATDSSPTGTFLRFRNFANNADLFKVNVDGRVDSAGILGKSVAASAGSVGEFVSNSAVGVALTNATAKTITSISLTAGVWDVSGTIEFSPAGSTTYTGAQVSSISTTDNTLDLTIGSANSINGSLTTGGTQRISTPEKSLVLASTTTIYLVAQSAFGVSTMNASGLIRARRA